MDRKFGSGRMRFVGWGTVFPVPITLSAAAYKGCLVAGLDPADNRVKLYFSDGTEWTRSIFDTTISEQIERLINDIFLNGFDEEDLPDPTLAENLRRYVFNNTRGLPAFAWDGRWNYITDEARVAEIAEELTESAIRVAEPDLLITVGAGGDYATLGEALEQAARLVPPVTEELFAGEIRILSGTVLNEQIFLINASLGWLALTSEDAVVDVNCTGWTKTTPFSTELPVRPWIYALGSTLPVIATKFRRVGTVPAEGMCFIRVQQSTFYTYSDTAVTPDARTHTYDAGFEGGTIGLLLESGSQARIDRVEVTGQTQYGIAVFNSDAAITECRVRAANSIYAANNSRLRISSTDYRTTAGTDAPLTDLVLAANATVSVNTTSFGGIPAVGNSHGIIFREGNAARQGRTDFDARVDVFSNSFSGLRYRNTNTTNGFGANVALLGPVGSGIGTIIGHTNRNTGGTQAAFYCFQTDENAAFVRNILEYDYTAHEWKLSANGDVRLAVNSAAWLPGVDNTVNAGSGSQRLKEIFCANNVINTSDEREKLWRGELTAAELRAAVRMIDEIGVFQWLASVEEKGKDARLHTGPRAQRVFAILEDEGLDWRRYGWCCHDKWGDVFEPEYEAAEVEIEEDGELVTRTVRRETGRMVQVQEAGDRYGIREGQFRSWLIVALAHLRKQDRAALDSLAVRVAALEAKA